MSGYTDKVSSVKMKYYDLTELLDKTDYSGSKPDATKVRYNFSTKNGVLYRGLGVEEAGMFEGKNMRSVHYFRRYQRGVLDTESLIVGVTTSGEFLYTYANPQVNGSEVYKVEGVKIRNVPSFVNYNFQSKDYLIINDGFDGMYVFDGSAITELENPVVSNIAIYDNMMFGCSMENYACVKYAQLSTPSAWSSNMSSMLLYNECGMVQTLATIKRHLFVFQDFGITRITRYDGLTGSYELSKIWYSGEKIVPGSVAVCGDDIYFCTHSGVYSFNGTTVRRVLTELDGFITPDEYARICFYNGKVHIASKVTLSGEPFETEASFYHNNALICYDPSSKKFEVYRGLCVTAFCPVPTGNSMLVAIDGYKLGRLVETGKVFDKKLYKYWETTASNFGSGNKKFIHSVRIGNDVPLEVRLIVDGKAYAYVVPPAKTRYFRLNKAGYNVAFSLKALESECNVTVPVIVYSEEVG